MVPRITRVAAVAVLTILAWSEAPVFAAMLHVDPNDPTAFQTIQEAIDSARNFDTIVVHPGIYTENIDFRGRAVTVTSLDPNDPAIVAETVIDGGGKIVVQFGIAETCHSVLSGLTVTNGSSGILCKPWSCCPTIKNCVISSNRSFGVTGGSPTVVACLITLTDDDGVNDCHGTIRDCIITTSGGYGIHNHNGDIVGCTITNSGKSGVAILQDDPQVTVNLRNCVISGNKGNGVSSGQGAVNIVNCTVVGNLEDGVVGLLSSSNILVSNSIVANNSQLGLGYCTHSTHTNVYGNQEGACYDSVLHVCGMQEPPWFADNGYWDAEGTWHQGDYHLTSTVGRWDPVTQAWVTDPFDSPCLDKGDPDTAVENELYPHGGRINLGAYGSTAQASKSEGPRPMCVEYPAMDFNHDCKVDLRDFAIFMEHWLECNFDDPSACWPDGMPEPPIAPNAQP